MSVIVSNNMFKIYVILCDKVMTLRWRVHNVIYDQSWYNDRQACVSQLNCI